MRTLNRILCVILLLLLSILSIEARGKYFGIAGQSDTVVTSGIPSTTKAVRTYPLCTVTVYLTGTTTFASIYSDNAGSVKANPFTAGSDASYSFYADAGRYDVRFSGTGITSPFTYGDVTVVDGAFNDFDPLGYGARGNGTTDDTVAVQAAVTALNTAGGGTLKLSKQFLISGSGTEILLFTKPVHIIGNGWGTGFLVASSTSSSTSIIHVKPGASTSEIGPLVSDVGATPGWGDTFENFSIEAQSGNPGLYAFYMDASASGSYIRGTHFSHMYIGKIGGTGASPTGIAFTGVVFNILIDGNFQFKRGILANGVADTFAIQNGRFEGPGRAIEYSAVSGATTPSFKGLNIYSAGGVWIKNALGLIWDGNIVETNSNAAGGSQNEGIEPYGHNGANADFDGTINGVSITNSVFGAPDGTTLDGLRVSNTTLPYIDHLFFNTPAGKNMYVLTASVVSPIVGGDIHILGASSSVSNSATVTIPPAYLYSTPQAAASSFAGNFQITGHGAFGSYPLTKWSLTNRIILGIGPHNAIMSGTTATPDLILANNAYNDGSGWRANATAASSFIEMAGGDNIFYGQGSVSADASVTPTERARIGTLGFSMPGMSAPAVSDASAMRFYFDSGANRLKLSQNTGAYSNILTLADLAAPGAIGGTTPASGAFTTLSTIGQITSTLATGTAPIVTSNTTPVAHLTTVPVTYNAAGTQQTDVHIVVGTVTLSLGTATVTLSGAAVFTSSASYNVLAKSQSGSSVQEIKNSGSSITFNGTASQQIDYIAIGN